MDVQKLFDRGWVCFRYNKSIPIIACLLGLYIFHPVSWEEEEDWFFSFLVFFPFLSPSSFLVLFLLFGCALVDPHFRIMFLISFLMSFCFVSVKTATFWILLVCWITFYILRQWRHAFSCFTEFRWVQKLSQEVFYAVSSFFLAI